MPVPMRFGLDILLPPRWSGRWHARMSLRGVVVLAALAVLNGLAGCAGLPPKVDRPVSAALVAPPDAALSHIAADAGVPSDQSGVWPMAQAAFALDARVTLMRNARTSLDVQSYLIGNDTIGRLMLREMRDAADRGVRVRLLVDDLYTEGLDGLLLGLQAHPNVEVRLFNPFVNGRDTTVGRLANFASDFRRLNHRMHNKLFIADGVMAVAGGRNMADEYFLRAKANNFVDMDLLISGALVPQLSAIFDTYWNSDVVFPLKSIVGTTKTAAVLSDEFEDRTSAPTDPDTEPPEGLDYYGAPAFSTQFSKRQYSFLAADASTHADSPDKASTARNRPDVSDTVSARFIELVQDAHSELLMFSPYFIPGKKGIDYLQSLRNNGVEIKVITNALGTSDEPLVNVSYERYRHQLLGMGVQLYELSATRITHDESLQKIFGNSHGRLHAKMAFIDRQTVLVGSMNLDPRSAYTNTEIGILVRSPELAKLILESYRVDTFAGVYEVKLKPDGSGFQWIAHEENGDVSLGEEPDEAAWEKFKLWFLHLFVPEDLL